MRKGVSGQWGDGGCRPGVILWTVCNICLREFFGNIRLHILSRHREKEEGGRGVGGVLGEKGRGRGWPVVWSVQGLMMDTISRLRCVQLKCGTDCVCVGTTVDTICGNAVANCVCTCVCMCGLHYSRLPWRAAAVKRLSLSWYCCDIRYMLSIYIDEFESYQSQFDVCLICMCACICLSICVYSLCVCSLCACVCVFLYPAAAAACHTLRNFCTTTRTTSSHKLPGLVACLAWRVDAAFVAAACRHTLT